MNLLTRDEALAVGSVKYFTGHSCVNGHISSRYTKSTTCVECHKRIIYKRREKVRSQFGEKSSEIIRLTREMAELSNHIGVIKGITEYEASTPNSPELLELRKIRDGMKELVKDYEFRLSKGYKGKHL